MTLLNTINISNIMANHPTGQLNVTLTATAVCTLTLNDVIFPSLSSTGLANQDVTSTMNGLVRCSPGITYYVGINDAVDGQGTRNMTSMNDPSQLLNYRIYTESGYANLWPNVTASQTDPNTSYLSTAGGDTLYMYLKIPSQPNIMPGTYTDIVTVTLTIGA
jgi:spore coat protein U-like protein